MQCLDAAILLQGLLRQVHWQLKEADSVGIGRSEAGSLVGFDELARPQEAAARTLEKAQ